MIDYFTGKLIYQVIDGMLNGESYCKFLQKVLRETSGKVIIIQDGAPYHRSRLVKDFTQENSERLTLYKLPSYSPDYSPIECVWRKIKRAATHHVYFENIEQLSETVVKHLTKLKRNPRSIKELFGVYTASKAAPVKA